MPSFITEQAGDLIRKILNTECGKRYTISQIMAHPWFNLLPNLKVNIGINPNVMSIPVSVT